MKKEPEPKFNLSPDRRARLESLLKERKAGPASRQGISRRASDDPAPLSFAQQRMWFLHRLEGSSEVYNVPMAFRLKGELNLEALKVALDRIVQRHEILRTVFREIDGEARQVVTGGIDLPFRLHDLRGEPPDSREARASEILVACGREWFDLSQEPLMRVDVIRLDDRETILLINMHHIIVDEWSHDVIFRELRALYTEEVDGTLANLPELPIQYADFAAWQLEWLDGEAGEKQMAYWKNALDGAPQTIDLPLDHPRPAVKSYKGARVLSQVSLDLKEKLALLARSERMTMFTLLLAAFNVLLYRYSGQADILVGTPIANRRQIELENLAGFFLNMLVLRGDLGDRPAFRAFLKRMSLAVLDAFDHQDLPFERIVDELKPPRELGRQPLFQVAFVYHAPLRRVLELAGLEAERIHADYGWSRFDLTLSVTDVAEGLDLNIEYSTDLFDRATIERMLGHFGVLLEAIARDPDRRVSDLPLLTGEEKRRLVEEWNATQTDYPRDALVHRRFEDRVRRTPEAVALVGEAGAPGSPLSRQITYGELNRRANQLAHYLRRCGIGRQGRVGICMERSPEMVIAMLGVLKAGGAYVPLDPAYPPDRLAFMIEDTGLGVLISMGEWAGRLPREKARVVRIDDDWPLIEGEPGEDLQGWNDPRDLAYIMYTSGSTGRPKGVGVPHRAILRLVCDVDYIQLHEGDRLAQTANMSFDAATFEVWGALLNGGCLVIFPQEIVLNPAAFARTLREQKIQTVFVTTALFNQIAMSEPGAFRMLRDVMFGGEAATPAWVRAVVETAKPSRLLHMYGPTESTTYATWLLVEEIKKSAHNVPIGRPIANTRLYILDRWLNLVPIGVPGELVIGGDGLAWGYLGRPELTAEKFIPDPFGEPGGRLYRTGDLARWLPDGSVEFLGRIDNQVKLRGFRVELGEIESVLNDHPAVDQSVVMLYAGGDRAGGDQRLVAYVVLHPQAKASPSDLRSYLKARLPDYMAPASFVFLDDLPLTPNGKLDRKALPRPAPERLAPQDTYAAPRDELEARLARLWEKVLDVQTVGVHDNFFDLGGHSLLAVRLFNQIEAEMGQRLPLATLFQSPTVAELAGVLRQEREAAEWTALVPIQPQGTRPNFYCVHNFGGETLDLEPLAQALGPDQPFYGLQALGLDGAQEPHASIEAMATYYVEAIRRRQPEGPYYLGGYCFGGVVAYEMARQLNEAGEEIALLATIDASAPGFTRDTRGLSPRRVWEFFANLPFWVRDFFQMDVAEQGVVVRRRLKRTARSVERRLGFEAELTPLEIIGDHVHVMEAPLYRRSMMELHMRALQNYVTPPYAGKVTAFRIRRMPLFSRQAFDMGWGRVARGGVDLRLVPGAHHNIMRPPYVRDLAAQLRECIDRAGLGA